MTTDIPDEELRRIAAPLTQPAAIRRWFARQGFVIREKPNGMPLISRAHFEAHLSAVSAPTAAPEETASNTPDTAGFLARPVHIRILDDRQCPAEDAGDDEYEADQAGAEQQGQGGGFGVEIGFHHFPPLTFSQLRPIV